MRNFFHDLTNEQTRNLINAQDINLDIQTKFEVERLKSEEYINEFDRLVPDPDNGRELHALSDIYIGRMASNNIAKLYQVLNRMKTSAILIGRYSNLIPANYPEGAGSVLRDGVELGGYEVNEATFEDLWQIALPDDRDLGLVRTEFHMAFEALRFECEIATGNKSIFIKLRRWLNNRRLSHTVTTDQANWAARRQASKRE